MDTTMLRVNGVCNAGCSFCALSGRMSVDLEASFERLQVDRDKGARHLRIGGGEPMLVSNLPDIVQRARGMGYEEITLETNGTIASLPGRAQQLAAAGLTDVLWALNAPNEYENSNVYGFADAHKASLAGAKSFLACGANVIVRTPLSATNLESLADTPAWLKENLPEVSTWWLRPLKRAKDAPFAGTELPSLEELGKVLPAVIRTARKLNIEVRIEDELGLPFCVFRSSPGLVSHLDQRGRPQEGDTHIHGGTCAECAVAAACPGQPLDYVNVHGQFEAKAFDRDIPALSRAASRPERIITYHHTGHDDRRAPGPQVTIRIIMPCNQACTFCFVDRTSASPPPETVFKALDDAGNAGADRISFSGGEPTLHPKLPEYARRARELEIPNVEIQTNALRLTDPELCDELVDAGINKAVVSLHAVDPHIYLDITGAGTPDEVISGIRNLLDRGVQVEVNVVHCESNLTHLPEVIRAIADRIPEVVVLLSVTYIVAGINRSWEDVAIRYTDAVPHLSKALNEAKKHQLDIRLTGRCSVPPCAWSDRLDELRELDLAHSTAQDSDDGHVYFEDCASCAAKSTCYGISKDYVKAFGQDEFRPISQEAWHKVRPRSRATFDILAGRPGKPAPANDVKMNVKNALPGISAAVGDNPKGL